MSYFVTGGTGFIGRFLIDRLLEREGTDPRAGAQGLGEEARRDARAVGRERQARGRRRRRPREAQARRVRGRPREAEGQGPAPLPPRRHLRPLRRRRQPGAGEHRRHAPRRPVRRGGQGRLLPPRELDRGRRPLRRRVPRGHVRGGRGARPPLLPHQARLRGHRAQGVRAALARSTAPRSSSATRRPARSTRSTAPTTSSSSSRRCARPCPSGCPRSASRGGGSTSCRWTSSSTRWTTSPTGRGWTAAAST